MLDRAHRLTDRNEFDACIRGGRRAGSAALVVHVSRVSTVEAEDAGHTQTRAGLVVGKAVGNAVERNRVKRRLRHLLRERLAALPAGTGLVVRALPPASATGSTELGTQLDALLARALRPRARS
jgi:ribonuclease P protein component